MMSGKIAITAKAPPERFGSSAQFATWVKQNQIDRVNPNPKQPQQWRFDYIAFLKMNPDDVELRIKFFDVTAQRRFVAGDSLYVSSRQQRVVMASMTLEREIFFPQRKYQMYVTDSRNVILAQTTFWLRGPTEKVNGRVNFSEEEAAGSEP